MNFITKQINYQKINYYSILLWVFYLPFNPKYLPYFLAFSFLTFIPLLHKFRFKRNHIPHYFMIGFYLLHIIGFMYSSNKASASFDLEVKLTIFLFPFFLILSDTKLAIDKKGIYQAFIYGSVLSVLFYIIVAFYHSIFFSEGTLIFNPHPEEAPWDSHFYYAFFSFWVQPSYYAMYLIFSIFLIIENWNDFFKKHRFFGILFVAILLLGIYFVSSRSGILSIGLLVLFYFFWLIKRSRLFYAFIPVIFLILAGMIFNKRVAPYMENWKKLSEENILKADERLQIWYADIQLISNHFLMGVGNGDVQDELKKVYEANHFENAYAHRLNAHNQFFETLIGLGVGGLVVLLMLIFYSLVISWRYRNDTLLFFLLLILLNFLFESMLSRINGVVFFAFFYSLLNLQPNRNSYDTILPTTD